MSGHLLPDPDRHRVLLRLQPPDPHRDAPGQEARRTHREHRGQVRPDPGRADGRPGSEDPEEASCSSGLRPGPEVGHPERPDRRHGHPLGLESGVC